MKRLIMLIIHGVLIGALIALVKNHVVMVVYPEKDEILIFKGKINEPSTDCADKEVYFSRAGNRLM